MFIYSCARCARRREGTRLRAAEPGCSSPLPQLKDHRSLVDFLPTAVRKFTSCDLRTFTDFCHVDEEASRPAGRTEFPEPAHVRTCAAYMLAFGRACTCCGDAETPGGEARGRKAATGRPRRPGRPGAFVTASPVCVHDPHGTNLIHPLASSPPPVQLTSQSPVCSSPGVLACAASPTCNAN